MSNRITQKDLQSIVDDLNSAKGFDPKECETSYKHINSYQLDFAYGGVKLVQIKSTGGGQISISPNGYGTKRELYTFLRGFSAQP